MDVNNTDPQFGIEDAEATADQISTPAEPGRSDAGDVAPDNGEDTTASTPTHVNLDDITVDQFMHDIPWKDTDYAVLGIVGPTAAKMYSSAIAPLVAAARGYTQINESNRTSMKRRFNLPEWNTKQGKALAKSLKEGDALIMPWYRAEVATQHQTVGVDVEPTGIQYRPESPRLLEPTKPGKKPKEAKYEFVSGDQSVIGLHPATPHEWLTLDNKGKSDVDTWILAEGLFKADAALSAILIASPKIKNEELLVTSTDQNENLTRLTMLMRRLDREHRIPILCIGGVYNWRANPEWNSLLLKGRDVWLGIDGDVATNPNVWRAANQLWAFIKDKKKANVFLLTPEDHREGGDIEKIGIDDYLKDVGNWNQLVSRCLKTEMPPAPADDLISKIDDWEVTDDGCSVSECVVEKDAAGSPMGAHWEVRVPMGGRILEMSKRRAPTQEETRTGVIGAGVSENDDSIESEVKIEVKWKDIEGTEHRHTIVGPHKILNYSADQWDRHGAKIPPEVTAHPAWPPRGGKTAEHSWLGAVKKYRADERSEPTVWTRMGWVPGPTKKAVPSFIVGDQVISHKGEDTITQSGVGEDELARALSFGVDDIVDADKSFDDDDFKAKVDEDLRKVIEAYITNEPWTNPGVGALIIAAALRPAVPLRPKGTVFVVGPPGKGKSYTAGAFMGFWNRNRGTWAADDLPGAASDSPAAIELACSRAPVWVIDDYHPTADGRKAQMMEDKISDVVRAQFNKTEKRRATNTMGSMKTNAPNAALMITGENELSTPSVRQRLVTITMRPGALHSDRSVTAELERVRDWDGAPARLTQYFIRFMQWYATEHGGWVELVRETEKMIHESEEELVRMLPVDSNVSTKRVGSLFADYYVSLRWLAKMAEVLGWNRRDRKMFGMEERMLGRRIADMICDQSKSMEDQTPGVALLKALHATLASNRAHIVDGTDFRLPPNTKTHDDNLPLSLGWAVSGNPDQPLRPGGQNIGYLVHNAIDEPVLLLNITTAFDAARKAFPNLIPAGQTEASSWTAAFDEGHVYLTGMPAPRSTRQPYRIRRRVGAQGTIINNLVPIKLDTFLEIASRSDDVPVGDDD